MKTHKSIIKQHNERNFNAIYLYISFNDNFKVVATIFLCT